MIQNISNEELTKLISTESSLQVLDVRQPDELFYLGYIPVAVNIPMMELPARNSELNKEKPLVVICEHGVRSADSAHYLLSLGFKHIYNLTRGMSEWDGDRVIPSQQPGSGGVYRTPAQQ